MIRKCLAVGPPVELPDDGEMMTLASRVREPVLGPVEFVGCDTETGVALFVDSRGRMVKSVLRPSRFRPPGNLPLAAIAAVSGRAFSRSAQEPQTGLTSPPCRAHLAGKRAPSRLVPGLSTCPVSMPANLFRHVNSCNATSSRSPPDP